MKNTYKRNFLISLALVIVGSGMLIYSGARAFSYEADTAFTEFYFTGDFGSGDANLPIYNADGTIVGDGGPTGTINFVLVNNSDMTITGNFYVVDAISLIEGTNIYGCKGMSDSTYFGSHNVVPLTNRTMDTGLNNFSLTYDFGNSVSGVHTGCVIFQPVGDAATSQNSVADAIPRKALIFAVNLTGTNPSHQVTMVANLGYRWSMNDGNGNANGFSGQGLLMFYNCDDRNSSSRVVVASGFVSMDWNGDGVSNLNLRNGCYDVVYKSMNGLAIYTTGLQYEGQLINFVSGFNVLGLFSYSDNNKNMFITRGSTGYIQLGDLPLRGGLYDGEINASDYSVLNDVCYPLYEANTGNYIEICDFNNNGKIESSDYSVIIPYVNSHPKDPTYGGYNLKKDLNVIFDFVGSGYFYQIGN